MPESTPTPAPLGRHHFYGRAPLPAADRTPAQKLRAEAPGAVKGTTATLRLYDPIDSYGGEFGVSAKEFAKVIDSLDASVNEIHLRINSPGGEVFDGIAIANTLRNHSAKVVAHIDGIAASAASVVAMAGDRIRVGSNALVMIHNPMAGVMGGAADLRAAADLLDKVRGQILDAYARHSKAGAEQLGAWMDAETWFTGAEAVEAGLAHEVTGGVSVAALAGHAGLLCKLGCRKVPEALAAAPGRAEQQAAQAAEETRKRREIAARLAR